MRGCGEPPRDAATMRIWAVFYQDSRFILSKESGLRRQVVKLLRDSGCYVLATSGCGVAGTPDLLCCIGGEFLGIELKTNTLASLRQRIAAGKIREACGACVLVNSIGEARAVLDCIRDGGIAALHGKFQIGFGSVSARELREKRENRG